MHVNLTANADCFPDLRFHQYHFPSSFKDLQTLIDSVRAVAGDSELEQQNGEIAPWTLCPSPESKFTTYCVMPRQATLSLPQLHHLGNGDDDSTHLISHGESLRTAPSTEERRKC